MNDSTDYVTKKDLDTALDKAVDQITEVIRDGFALAATKKELEDVRQELAKGVARVELNMTTKDDLHKSEERLLDEISGHEELEAVLTKDLEKRVHALEKQVFPKSM